jgi:type I restriction enzyme, S subunit
MNTDRLLSHFEKISDAPDAVERLRRFILDLAMRGTLVEQDLREGTATDLLAQHRVAVEASGEMQPFPLPESWAWVPVGVVCSKTGSGSTPRGGKTAYVSKGIPFLRSQNIHDDGLTLDDVAYIDAATHSKMIGTAVQPDDLLLNITGGSMGRCCHVPCSFKEGNVSQHVAILRAAIPGTQAFLHKCIISPFFQSLIFDEQTGAGRGGLPKNRMDRLPVPLPPLAEQHRIVEKVDELMMLCDRLEASQKERESRRDRLVMASLNRLSQPTDHDEFKKDARFQLSNLNRLSIKPQHIKQIRKAILNLAFTNGFTPERKSDSERVCVGEVAQLQNGYAFKSQWFKPNGVRLLRNANIGHGCLDWSEAVCLSADQAVEYERFELAEGDIVLSLDRPFISTGVKVARVTGDDLPSLLLQRVGRFVIQAERLHAEYLYRWLKSPSFAAQVDPGRSLGVPHISSKNVENAEIPLPPLAEQKRIVAKVDELMLICNQLENQLESQQKGRRHLLEALLHEALEGVG